MNIKELIEKSNLKIDKNKILFDEQMSKYTSFKIGGPAECLIKITNIEDLYNILLFAKKNNVNITVLGNGSNTLVLDGGIKGITLLIRTDDIKLEEKENKDVYITVDSGCKISKLAQILLKNEITGFEEISGIPGTVGGAIKMNAGAHGKEIKDILEEVKCIDFDGNIKILSNKDLKFGYRTSIFFQEKEMIILSGRFKLKKGIKRIIESKMKEYTKFRIEKQPIEVPNAGSTFKRGQNFITAKLIDEAGLKGYSVGDAEVSTKHSGFIINKGNATAKDVLELIKYVKEEVFKKFGEKIELEIEVLGEND